MTEVVHQEETMAAKVVEEIAIHPGIIGKKNFYLTFSKSHFGEKSTNFPFDHQTKFFVNIVDPTRNQVAFRKQEDTAMRSQEVTKAPVVSTVVQKTIEVARMVREVIEGVVEETVVKEEDHKIEKIRK